MSDFNVLYRARDAQDLEEMSSIFSGFKNNYSLEGTGNLEISAHPAEKGILVRAENALGSIKLILDQTPGTLVMAGPRYVQLKLGEQTYKFEYIADEVLFESLHGKRSGNIRGLISGDLQEEGLPKLIEASMKRVKMRIGGAQYTLNF